MVCATIPPMPRTPRDRYVVKSLVHASDILGAFESAGDVLRLRDVVERTGLNKGMCFRLLYTLHQCGFLETVDELRYRMTAEVPAAQAVPDRPRRAGTERFVRARGARQPAGRRTARPHAFRKRCRTTGSACQVLFVASVSPTFGRQHEWFLSSKNTGTPADSERLLHE